MEHISNWDALNKEEQQKWIDKSYKVQKDWLSPENSEDETDRYLADIAKGPIEELAALLYDSLESIDELN